MAKKPAAKKEPVKKPEAVQLLKEAPGQHLVIRNLGKVNSWFQFGHAPAIGEGLLVLPGEVLQFNDEKKGNGFGLEKEVWAISESVTGGKPYAFRF